MRFDALSWLNSVIEYESDAFTGAKDKGEMGLFELANHGTILLGEIGVMSLALQAKLLRAVQRSGIVRVV